MKIAGFFRKLFNRNKIKQGEEALTRAVLDNSPQLIEMWSLEGKLLDCNQQLAEAFGFSNKAAYLESAAGYDYDAPVQPCGTNAEELHMGLVRRAAKEGLVDLVDVCQR